MKLLDFIRKKTSKNTTTGNGMAGGLYSGGDGLSFENAVIIRANSETTGISAEYSYIAQKVGPRGSTWELGRQSLVIHGNRHYDIIEVTMKNGEQIAFYFDISEFFRKF